MSDGLQLLHRHLNGETLADHECQALSAWVCASKDNAKLAAELTCLDQTLVSNLRTQASTPLMGGDDEMDLIDDTLSRDAYAPEIMQELVAQAVASKRVSAQAEDSAQQATRPASTPHFSASDATWVAGKVFKHIIKTKAAAITAVAAVLLLALWLINPFEEPDQPVGPEVAIPTVHPDKIDKPIVATLTAAHNAHWAERALVRGSDLRAGQRLTLTAGFVEITTNRGAIAIIEAPATIELLDNNNALRLHVGKLVGICETESSKGFLVRTPHIDVIDLGTRFGVDVSQAASTEVHVLQGAVQAIRTDASHREPITLTARQALKADANQVERMAVDTARFVVDPVIEALRPRFEGLATAWLGRISGDVRSTQQTSKALQVYLERSGYVLDQPVAVDIDKDTPWPGTDLASQTVSAGERVDIYLLHLDTPGEYSIDDGDYALHFDRPILGVIGHESTLRATDGSLGVAGVLYPPMPTDPGKMRQAFSGIDNAETFGKPDFVSVTLDGQSLTLRLNSSTQLDQLRVLVQAADR